jgi:hypothetical protein
MLVTDLLWFGCKTLDQLHLAGMICARYGDRNTEHASDVKYRLNACHF